MNWTFLILWLLFGLGVHSLLIVPILMELAVDRKQRRTPEGELRIKKNGWVIENCYLGNVFKKTNEIKYIPKNICQLYWGIFFGSIFCCTTFYFMLIITVSFLGGIGFLFGYALNFADRGDRDRPSNFYHSFYHPYQRYGKNDEKKFIAPWKILLAIFLFFRIILKGKTILLEVISILTLTIAIYVYVTVLGIVAVVWIINKIRKQEFWSATREFLKAKKNKVCLKIVPIEIEK